VGEPQSDAGRTGGRGRFSSRLPANCDFSVTNVCNAACDFCGFARGKLPASASAYADADRFAEALPILHRRGVRYVTLQGGEPLVHPDILRLTANITEAGMHCSVITNGWFLPRYVKGLAAAGLKRLVISIDSADLAAHEGNRGLPGLNKRITEGIREARGLGLPVMASVTVSRLVNYDELPETLTRFGFDAVSFSYPRREPFGSNSLNYSETSSLVDFSRDELLDAFAAIARMKKRFPVFNPAKSLAEVSRYVRGEAQTIPCVAGYKYFYLDWNLDIWRCEAWDKPLGSVFDLDRIPDQREPCHSCMQDCYRSASMLMHAGVAITDGLDSLAEGHVGAAIRTVFRASVMQSLAALAEQGPQHLRHLAGRRLRRRAVAPAQGS
jgi:MoaA/NifB/PqqE/SkfB family radical SAM enzyme